MANAPRQESSGETSEGRLIKKSKTTYFWTTVIISNMSAFICGSYLGWLMPIFRRITSESPENPFGKPITPVQEAWIVASFSIGAIIGPPLSAFTVNRIGRKNTLMNCVAIPYFMAFLILGFSEIVFLYYIGRLLGGFALGNNFVALPMYLGEISDLSVRGRVLSLINVFVCLGVFFSFSVGPHLSIISFCLLCSVTPAAFFIIFSSFYDTPHFYLMRGDVLDAEWVLMKLRNATREEVRDELEMLQDIVAKEREENKSFTQLCKSLKVTRELFMTMGLFAFQQCNGLVFEAGIINDISAKMIGVIVGALQVSASLVAPIIIDHSGRKLLLFVSGMGMAISTFGLGVYIFSRKYKFVYIGQKSWLAILSLILLQVSYHLGYGPIPWVIVGEIFPPAIKPLAIMVTVIFCWSVNFLFNYFVPILADAVGRHNVLWFISFVNMLGVFFTQLFVIETKNLHAGHVKARSHQK